MILTGEMIDAARAAEIGLANLLVPHEELAQRSRDFLGRILQNGPVALEMALRSTYAAAEATMAQGSAFRIITFRAAASTDDMHEGMAAFLGKRKADFKGE